MGDKPFNMNTLDNKSATLAYRQKLEKQRDERRKRDKEKFRQWKLEHNK